MITKVFDFQASWSQFAVCVCVCLWGICVSVCLFMLGGLVEGLPQDRSKVV